MAKVKILRSPRIGKFPATWDLYRLGTGPGRCEGVGFKTKKDAIEFAKKYGHEVV